MRSRRQIARRRGIFVSALLLILLIALFGWWQTRARRGGGLSPIDHLLIEVLMPSARAASQVRALFARDPNGTISTTVGLDAYTQLQDENAQLRAALALRDSLPRQAIAVEVIGRIVTTSPWQGALVLSKGAADGLEPHMVVLAPTGVVGHIQTVTAHTANVLPITARDQTDHGGGIGARIRRTKAYGILKGAGAGMCSLEYLQGGEDVQPGDIVETSGLSQIFPAGFTLGTVEQVAADPAVSSVKAVVRPTVDLAKTDIVLAITSAPAAPPASGLPTAPPGDAAARKR